MDKENNPECSQKSAQNVWSHHSNTSREVANSTYNLSTSTTPDDTKAASIYSFNYISESNLISQSSSQLNKSFQEVVTSKPLNILHTSTSGYNYPQSLFLQALSKLNENTLSCVTSQLKLNTVRPNQGSSINNDSKNIAITPPDSLTSAPPSYSFVLRQMAARRPRLMGTFIPSPSFVQHTPPPNYATAFDIYVDNPIAPPPPTRVYVFGFVSMPVACQECGYVGMTRIRSKITLCTHICSLILCLLCCWVCAPLPYIMRSCKDVYHYCGNCSRFLGRYCPSNPDNR